MKVALSLVALATMTYIQGQLDKGKYQNTVIKSNVKYKENFSYICIKYTVF